jgi:hypothetical protein
MCTCVSEDVIDTMVSWERSVKGVKCLSWLATPPWSVQSPLSKFGLWMTSEQLQSQLEHSERSQSWRVGQLHQFFLLQTSWPNDEKVAPCLLNKFPNTKDPLN